MADPQEPHSLASTFPNPPPFWKDFTPDNIARIDELRKAYSNHHQGETPHRIPGVPEDLANLQPPAEPTDGRWRVFGDHYTVGHFTEPLCRNRALADKNSSMTSSRRSRSKA